MEANDRLHILWNKTKKQRRGRDVTAEAGSY
jgi:hypothetical protein